MANPVYEALQSGYSMSEVQAYTAAGGASVNQPSIQQIMSGNVQALTSNTAMETITQAQQANNGPIPIPGGTNPGTTFDQAGGATNDDAGTQAAAGAPAGSLPGTINQSQNLTVLPP